MNENHESSSLPGVESRDFVFWFALFEAVTNVLLVLTLTYLRLLVLSFWTPPTINTAGFRAPLVSAALWTCS